MNLGIMKQIRENKGYRLVDLSKKTGYTVSYLSQLERGLKQPSIVALRRIAESLDVPVATFLLEDDNKLLPTEENNTYNNDCNVIRKNSRKKFLIHGHPTETEILTPTITNSQDRTEIAGVYSKIMPGCWASEKLVSHNFDESDYIVKGKVKAYVGDNIYMLEEGDSIYIYKNLPHNLLNCGEEILVLISYFSTDFLSIL